MTLGAEIAAALPELRAAALSRMTERCIIREADSWPDEVLTPGAVAFTYAGSNEIPCRVKDQNVAPAIMVVGGEQRPAISITVCLPVELHPLAGQVITIVSSGRRLDVKAAEIGDQVVERRVRCEEHDGAVG